MPALAPSCPSPRWRWPGRHRLAPGRSSEHIVAEFHDRRVVLAHGVVEGEFVVAKPSWSLARASVFICWASSTNSAMTSAAVSERLLYAFMARSNISENFRSATTLRLANERDLRGEQATKQLDLQVRMRVGGSSLGELLVDDAQIRSCDPRRRVDVDDASRG